MKKLLILVTPGLILAGFLAVSCRAYNDNSGYGRTTVATDATMPPFEFVDKKTNEIVGFDIDIMRAIAARESLNIEFQNKSWDVLLAGMARGTYDCAISCITITDDRKQDMLFSEPYFAAGQVVVVRAENTNITGKDTLMGQVGVQKNTEGDNEVKEIKNVTAVEYNIISSAFQDLRDDNIDAVVCDNAVAVVYVGDSHGEFKLAGPPFTDEQYGIAVAKDKSGILKKINDGLKDIKAGGLIDKAAAAWFK